MNLFQRFKKSFKKFLGIEEKKITTVFIGSEIRVARETILKLSHMASEVPHYRVREDIYEIIKISRKGLDNLENNPKDIPKASKFLNYYLKVVPFLVEKYIKLAKIRRSNGSINDTMKRIEVALSKVVVSFERQVEKMYSDDVFDIETEIDLLERFVKNENY